MTLTPEIAQGRLEDVRSEIKKIAYTEPFTENTRKIKTNLLIFSSITILSKAYSFRLDEIPFLHIRVPDEAPYFLDSVLSAALIYFFIFFCVGSYQDLKAWILKKEEPRLRFVWDVFYRIETGLQYHKVLLENCKNERVDTEKLSLSEDYASKMSKELDDFSKFLEKVYIEHQKFSWSQRIRIWGLEVVFPLLIGLLAVVKSIPSFFMLLPLVF